LLQGASYKGALTLDLCWDVEGLPGTLQVMQKRLGSLPIMVKSTACHLHGECQFWMFSPTSGAG
jgi:hypothetical protein